MLDPPACPCTALQPKEWAQAVGAEEGDTISLRREGQRVAIRLARGAGAGGAQPPASGKAAAVAPAPAPGKKRRRDSGSEQAEAGAEAAAEEEEVEEEEAEPQLGRRKPLGEPTQLRGQELVGKRVEGAPAEGVLGQGAGAAPRAALSARQLP